MSSVLNSESSKTIGTLEKTYSHLFFIFFAAQILSPEIDGIAIYLELLIALVNPYFLNWTRKIKIKKTQAVSLVLFLVLIASGGLFIAIKVLAIIIAVAYLIYSQERECFYLFRYVVVSILFAVAQFVFLKTNPAYSFLLSPTYISQIIWGDYSVATFSNFFTVFMFERVSGLSREAGFMASLLVAVTVLYVSRLKEKENSVSIVFAFLMGTGLVLSFSKMTLVVIPALLLILFKKEINKFPYPLMPLFFTVALCFFWIANYDFLIQSSNVSYLHRFAAYVALPDLQLYQLLLGINSPYEIDSSIVKVTNFHFLGFAGFAGQIINNGLLSMMALLGLIYIFGIGSAGLLLLLMLTLNTSLETNQNFVVLAYFIVFKYFRRCVR